MSRTHGCVVSQQLIHATTCFSRDSLQQIGRRRVNSVHQIRNRWLAYADAFRECGLGGIGPFEVGAERLHNSEGIGLPYEYAIGAPYRTFAENWSMAKTRERTFLERALEALKERYPRERPTQVRLAKIAGVSQPAVFEWGLPGRAPAHSQVLLLAKTLNVCVEWLYTERGPKNPAVIQDAESFVQTFQALDPELKRQAERYIDFLRGEPRQ